MLKRIFLSVLVSAIPIHLLLGESATKIIPAKNPNGCLLIFAHGYRPEGFANPATLEDEGLAYKTLHDQGWTLAATSYRKAGMVVAEGAEDIDQLRDAVEKKYGPIRRCLLHGESMGGTIVTMLVERDPQRYQGAVAVGAALDLLPTGTNWRGPKSPLLFLTNQSELSGPQKYVEQFRATSKNLVLWKVARDGHCNVNQAEVSAALLALNQALDGKPMIDQDATVQPAPGPSQAVVVKTGIEVNIKEIDPVFGNFVVVAQSVDLAKIGLKRGDRFQLIYGHKIRPILLGKEFNDVPEGDWVAFENADGWLRIAMNFRNAATNLGVKKGDKIILSATK